ncbi:MAG TPA: alpha/beta hydrolase [Candidatus Binataceae bacterium]|nr:alpha/beta hydrolase [Candidatus Binataceae bacterium]
MTTPLDPQMKAMLDVANAAGPAFLRADTASEARVRMQALVAARPAPKIEMHEVRNRTIPGPAGEIPLRIYTPGPSPNGILVYFHGGGWVLGDLDIFDVSCRSIATAAGCRLVSVDYRLAPENKFPAAPEDCYAATKWVSANAKSLGGDPARIAVGGDSAGGNLATVTALMARDRGGPPLCFQVLFYPAISAADDTPSQFEFAQDGFILSRADMEWFWGKYLRNAADASNSMACPNRAASLSGLPPALIQTASHDPLRDEGESYAEQLRRAGVPVKLTRYEGLTHGFVAFSDLLDKGKEAIREAGSALRAAFAK